MPNDAFSFSADAYNVPEDTFTATTDAFTSIDDETLRFADEEVTQLRTRGPSRGNVPRTRQHFDPTQLSDEDVDTAIAKAIRRKSGAKGTASRQISASQDEVEFMLKRTTEWRRNVHASNPRLAALPPNEKGTILHSSVAKRLRQLNIEGLQVNERLNSPFLAPGTSQHLSPVTGLPYKYRIPDFRMEPTIFDIKPAGTPLSGPQFEDFMSFGNTSDVRFIYYDPF